MRMILKNFNHILPLLIIVAILLGISPAYGAQEIFTADEADNVFTVDEMRQFNMDFDLSDEILQADEVLSQFTPNDPDGFYVYSDPQSVAAQYIPEGAVCTDLCIIGYVVSIDYRIGDVRYIVAYCNDGTVRLTASLLGHEVRYVYEMSSDTPNAVRCIDCEKNVVVWESETEEP